MKVIHQKIMLSAIFPILIYLAMAFILLECNPTKWSQVERAAFVGMIIISTGAIFTCPFFKENKTP